MMGAGLFLETLHQLLHDLFPAAQGLDFGFFLVRQITLSDRLQPLGGNLGFDRVLHQLQTAKHVAEHLVELVVVPLVLHQGRAGEIVEILNPPLREIGLQGLHQRQVFFQRDRELGGFQLVEEGGEHGLRRRLGIYGPNNRRIAHEVKALTAGRN